MAGVVDNFTLVAAERAIARLLARDPATPARLRALDGRSLRLVSKAPPLALRVSFTDTGIRLSRVSDWQQHDDLVIGVDRRVLERWVAGDSLERLLFNGDLDVSGDTGMLAPLQALLLDLDLDWEGALAQALGATPAHGLARALGYLTRQARASAGEWRQDWREYLFEEARLMAGQDQLEVARDALSALRLRVDRLSARVTRLERQHTASAAQEPRP
ncbi:SCP2 domain-containing protein [Salinicola sp. DM10]|uniref:ubiquinone biosynthesis accessory factor UbiJ n=1 Tax=Salinicola sp. DM10 TaxID=2815721 RepID=UPI001A8D9DAD|nr:SCP2 sterol-binding domain-containing protein [Salinicola sp. DM10]MCE3026791.1 SCP2 sterol-binding domain-containing protein [Salinicola sp. DM10]